MSAKNNMLSTAETLFAFLSWRPAEIPPPERKIPVTVLSGFLGAGKTTLLMHLLRSRPQEKFGLLINDVGDVNLDANTVERGFQDDPGPVAVLQELTSGCICCSLGDALADAMVTLYEKTPLTHLIIEASGAANPRNLLQSFYTRNRAGHSLLDVFRICNMVTVIVAAHFLQEWEHAEGDRKKKRRIFLNDPRKPYLELIMDQIETCDVLAVNKLDLVSEAESRKVCGILRDLNPRAFVLPVSEGVCDPATLLDTPRFTLRATQSSSAIDQRLKLPWDPPKTNPVPRHHGYGLRAVVFRARRPFRDSAFFQIIRGRIPGLLRAKGFYWSDAHPDQCGILSLAGGVLRADRAGPWYADLMETDAEGLPETMPEYIRAVWEPITGDRRQELVFIGTDLNGEEIQALLQSALVPE